MIYEGTNQVKESKIGLLMHIYELFSMKDDESIIKMFTRFTNITNELQALGKAYTEMEKVIKILRCLTHKWQVKVITIQEVKDLTKLPMEELIGSLMTHEITMKNHQEVEDEKKKNIALKISQNNEKEVDGNEEEERNTSEEYEDLAFISR